MIPLHRDVPQPTQRAIPIGIRESRCAYGDDVNW